jgi:hypothetical protein
MCGSFEVLEEKPPEPCRICGKPAERSLVVAYCDRSPNVTKHPQPPIFSRVFPLCGDCRWCIIDDVSEVAHFRVSLSLELAGLREVKSA